MLNFKRGWVVLVVIAASACGGSGPTGPSNSIPNVVGNYSGNTTLAFPQRGTSVTCPTSTSVTQSGNTVSIAPLILAGPCGNLSVPLGQTTIDATGAFMENPNGTVDDPSCGTYSYAASGGFFGRSMQMSINATSRTCSTFNMTTNVSH